MTGGAQEYVRRLTAGFTDRIRTNCGALSITRDNGEVQVLDNEGGINSFDRVVIATHGDEALALLKDADLAETSSLSRFRYQKNRAVLHRDTSLMPLRRRCWASWVYISDGEFLHPRITVTYWMNQLQGIDEKYPLFVSLNPQRPIASDMIFDEVEFDHPVFDDATIAAQAGMAALQGRRNTWFAGAHLGHGFHEDGLTSAVAVARGMGCAIPWTKGVVADNPPPASHLSALRQECASALPSAAGTS